MSHDIDIPASLAKAVDKRLSEFVAGRYCAREALKLLGLTQPPSIGIRPDRGPDRPEGVVGAITHTDGFAWAAVARQRDLRGIGIDR